jgi:hypothetical protein
MSDPSGLRLTSSDHMTSFRLDLEAKSKHGKGNALKEH